ncbi:MAG: hypothetical protein HYV63_20820 [Candidatus Schekmanbacteria bacterium]|nr:hypothetical protein [Candidatus Schekmanbacteria bacterium]
MNWRPLVLWACLTSIASMVLWPDLWRFGDLFFRGIYYRAWGSAETSQLLMIRAALVAPHDLWPGIMEIGLNVREILRRAESGEINELDRLYARVGQYAAVRGDKALLWRVLIGALDHDRPEPALYAAEELQRLTPTDIVVALYVAKALSAAGHFPEADRQLAGVLSRRPEFPDAIYELGVLAERQHRLDAARRSYDRVRRLFPRHLAAMAAVRRLGGSAGMTQDTQHD